MSGNKTLPGKIFGFKQFGKNFGLAQNNGTGFLSFQKVSAIVYTSFINRYNPAGHCSTF